MISLYSDYAKLPENITWIQNIEAYFRRNIFLCDLSSHDIQVMEELEGVKPVPDSDSLCFGLFGASMSFHDISSGLKTVLLISQLRQRGIKDTGVFLMSCGDNYLDAVFAELDNSGIVAYTGYIPRYNAIKVNRDFTVNETKVVHTAEDLFFAITGMNFRGRLDPIY